MSIKIENIRPSYDQDEGHDILEFTVNGEKCSEYLSGSFLGREIYGLDGLTAKSRLSDDYAEAQVSEIHSKLEEWIVENKDERFARKSDNPDVECVEHGLNVSHGNIAVWLTPEAADRLNLADTAYEVTSNGSISWADRDFGDQYHENNPGGDQEILTKHHNLAHAESCIWDIELDRDFGQLAQLRKEAENDPKNAPAI